MVYDTKDRHCRIACRLDRKVCLRSVPVFSCFSASQCSVLFPHVYRTTDLVACYVRSVVRESLFQKIGSAFVFGYSVSQWVAKWINNRQARTRGRGIFLVGNDEFSSIWMCCVPALLDGHRAVTRVRYYMPHSPPFSAAFYTVEWAVWYTHPM